MHPKSEHVSSCMLCDHLALVPLLIHSYDQASDALRRRSRLQSKIRRMRNEERSLLLWLDREANELDAHQEVYQMCNEDPSVSSSERYAFGQEGLAKDNIKEKAYREMNVRLKDALDLLRNECRAIL